MSTPAQIDDDDVVRLGDSALWINRMEITSDSVDDHGKPKKYIIAKNSKTRTWACSCTGWIMNHTRWEAEGNGQTCRHLTGLGLTGRADDTPAQVIIDRIGEMRWEVQTLRDAAFLKEKKGAAASGPGTARKKTAGNTHKKRPLGASNSPYKRPGATGHPMTPVPAQNRPAGTPNTTIGNTTGILRAMAKKNAVDAIVTTIRQQQRDYGFTEDEVATLMLKVSAELGRKP